MSHAQDENQQIKSRRVKLDALRENGVNPYTTGFKPETKNLKTVINSVENCPVPLDEVRVKVAGRMILYRHMGKLTFATLQDEDSHLQICVKRDVVGADLYRNVFRKIERGDFIGVEGYLFYTQTGELTVQVESFTLLTKAVRPLPEKFHGLEDTETRYRQRYVDLIVNREVHDIFKTRSKIISYIRQYMEAEGFLEVETPMLHPIPGGATARPFTTHYNVLDSEFYLRIAPELYLKRLIVGGFERVFEINRNFRNEGVSTKHNPEFTMMEFYQAYTDYKELMDFTVCLITNIVGRINGSMVVNYQGTEIDFTGPWDRLNLPQSIVKYMNADEERMNDRQYLEELAQGLGIEVQSQWDDGTLMFNIFEEGVEHKLIQPTFIIDYPISVSPLSRRSDSNPDVAERFELFIAGNEIANAFSELNDPADQAERFRSQVEAKDAGDDEAMFFDEDYVRALEYGMPPTGGEGIGIDRLVMLLTNSSSIREVLFFPQMKEIQ